MREVYAALKDMAARNERGALVTVVKTRGSTPQRAGAKMLILASGEIVGTVGGGCVEAEVWLAAREVLTVGEPKFLTINLTADKAADSGMICGGAMDMFIEPVDPQGTK
jgi:xanthine dehydrogenase accessory factor